MSILDAFRFDGKRVLVVGGATGMGAAAAELAQDAGAEVVVMDFAEVTLAGGRAIHVNLAEQASIDAAVDECGGRLDVVLACAGVADGTPGIERINFIGHRHLIDRLLADGPAGSRGRPSGSSRRRPASAGRPTWPRSRSSWPHRTSTAAVAWVEAHGKADYMSTKQAVCAYVASQAFPLLKQGIRINAICPGPTETPLALANKATWLGFGADYRGEVGIEASTPLEQAYPLVFLCSDAAAAITGITMITDAGYISSGITGSFPGGHHVANLLLDRVVRLEAIGP